MMGFLANAIYHRDLEFIAYVYGLEKKDIFMWTQYYPDQKFGDIVKTNDRSFCEQYIKRFNITKLGLSHGLIAACSINSFDMVKFMCESGATNFYNGLLEAIESHNSNSNQIIDYLLEKYAGEEKDDLTQGSLFVTALLQDVDLAIVEHFVPSSPETIIGKLRVCIWRAKMNITKLKFVLQKLEKLNATVDYSDLLKLVTTSHSSITHCDKDILAHLLICGADPKLLQPHARDMTSKFITHLIRLGVPQNSLPDIPLSKVRLKLWCDKRVRLSKEIHAGIPIHKNIDVTQYVKMIVDYVFINPGVVLE